MPSSTISRARAAAARLAIVGGCERHGWQSSLEAVPACVIGRLRGRPEADLPRGVARAWSHFALTAAAGRCASVQVAAMFLSVFDIFKVGVGPSSSHTMGPMVAAAPLPRPRCARRRPRSRVGRAGAPRLPAARHLAFTGKGHATDRAVILGLAGFEPDDLRRRPGRGGAGARSRRRGTVDAAGPAAPRLRPGRGPRLRLRAAAARPCQRPGALRPATRPGNVHRARRPTIRSAAASSLTARELARPAGAPTPGRRSPTRSTRAAEMLAHGRGDRASPSPR